MTDAPTWNDIFAVMSAASVGDSAARVPLPDDPELDHVESRFAIALNLLLDDLAMRGVERERAEEQLRQAQKMEAIGSLAGGVAHDFNNLLSVILGYSEMLLASDLTDQKSVRVDVGEIMSAAERAADLTRQLLAFSRQQVLATQIVDLNDVIMKIDRLVRRILGEDVELRTLPASGLWKVKVDPSQVEQVVMNLVVNARDAMPTGGTQTIETANVYLDEAYAREHVGVTPGPHVMLAVSDDGIGMDSATQARIFEPFFTTKETGKGTGLGLATVFGIVKQSGGTIWLYSESGIGTTFKVYLPWCREETEATLPEAVRAAPGRGETILLVEDEPQVRKLVHQILTVGGYVVLEALDVHDGLRIGEELGETIDLLLTDVVMPGMSGQQVAERMLATRPELKVLYVSGYTDSAIVRHGVLEPGVSFLQKPITPNSLLSKVREVLDAG